MVACSAVALPKMGTQFARRRASLDGDYDLVTKIVGFL